MRYFPGLLKIELLFSGCSITNDPPYLLALFAGFVTLLVGLIMGLLLGLLVMIVQIAAGCSGDRARSQSYAGVTRVKSV